MTDGDPSQDELLALHHALLAGDDPTAKARLAALLLPSLRQRFARRRDLDQADIESLIGESITKYVNNPDRYDPDRAPLLAYLYQDVNGDIRNEVAKRARRPAETATDDEILELRADRGNPTPEDEVVDRLDPLDLPRERVRAALDEIARFSPEEREFLRLRLAGVRSTQPYAEVLGVAHLPADQRRREVKRVKDRLDKRLRSIGDRLR